MAQKRWAVRLDAHFYRMFIGKRPLSPKGRWHYSSRQSWLCPAEPYELVMPKRYHLKPGGIVEIEIVE